MRRDEALMLDNFLKIYNKELRHYETPIEKLILNSVEVRTFVYEVCKYCVLDELDNIVKQKDLEIEERRSSYV